MFLNSAAAFLCVFLPAFNINTSQNVFDHVLDRFFFLQFSGFFTYFLCFSHWVASYGWQNQSLGNIRSTTWVCRPGKWIFTPASYFLFWYLTDGDSLPWFFRQRCDKDYQKLLMLKTLLTATNRTVGNHNILTVSEWALRTSYLLLHWSCQMWRFESRKESCQAEGLNKNKLTIKAVLWTLKYLLKLSNIRWLILTWESWAPIRTRWVR